MEFYAVRPLDRSTRKIVTFDPPRRYAHYLAADDWLFLSGMAEEGDTMDVQFDKAFAQVQGALDLEGFTWADVCSASLFLQSGQATPDWMLERFRLAALVQPSVVSFELVDELANTPKHLEIEIIARRSRANDIDAGVANPIGLEVFAGLLPSISVSLLTPWRWRKR